VYEHKHEYVNVLVSRRTSDVLVSVLVLVLVHVSVHAS